MLSVEALDDLLSLDPLMDSGSDIGTVPTTSEPSAPLKTENTGLPLGMIDLVDY